VALARGQTSVWRLSEAQIRPSGPQGAAHGCGNRYRSGSDEAEGSTRRRLELLVEILELERAMNGVEDGEDVGGGHE
jgi:hypothetical protein